jgi:hypothetical protein
MEKNDGNNSFSGFNIETIEKEIGIKLPASGDAGDKKDTIPDDKSGKDTKTTFTGLGLDISQKIQIPETPEEFAALTKEVKKEKEEGGSPEIKDKEKELRGEDAVIKEDSPLYLHAATLFEEGILPTLNLEDLKGKKYSEGLQLYLSAQKKYIEDGRNEYINSLTDRQKEFLEMIELGIPQDNVEHQFTIEDSYGKITDEILSDDAQLQKDIIVQNYKLKGISDKKIEVFIKSAENDERLFEEAKDALSDINAYIAQQKQQSIDAAKTKQQEAEQKEKDLQVKIKGTIDGLEEILPGIKLSANEKTKLYDYMTKPVEERIINGRKMPIDIITKTRFEDPIAFNLRTAYFITLGLYDKKADLSKFIKKTTSSAVDKLTSRLKDDPSGQLGKGLKIEKTDGGSDKKEKIIFPKFM